MEECFADRLGELGFGRKSVSVVQGVQDVVGTALPGVSACLFETVDEKRAL
jgi:hypothetical protein